jgi:hypothetical protein
VQGVLAMSNKNHWNSYFLSGQHVSDDWFGDDYSETSLDPEIVIKVSADINSPSTFPAGFVDKSKLDATTEKQITQQKKQDDEQARLDALNKNA